MYWGVVYLESKASYTQWQSLVDRSYELLNDTDSLVQEGKLSQSDLEYQQRKFDGSADTRDEQAETMDRAAYLGPVVPASMLVLFGLGYWVRQGFNGSNRSE